MYVRIASIFAACACLLAGAAHAGVTNYSGRLDDNTNPALRGSGPSPAPAGFTDEYEIANNVAVHAFTVDIGGTVTFDSNGFAAAGADPYFSLFAGSDDGATFLGSNYVQAFSTGGDFVLDFVLAPGQYQFALGVFANMSLAENYGSGTLGDGFAALGEAYYLGSSYYEIAVTTPDRPVEPVPEPAGGILLLMGLVSLAAARARRKD